MVTFLTRVPLRTRRAAVTALLAGLAAMAVAAGLGLARPNPQPTTGITPDRLRVATRPAIVGALIPVPVVTAPQLARLPEATTATTLLGAPRDPEPDRVTGGTVVHNTRPLPLFTAPGGPAFARLPTTQTGAGTWLPVIATQPGWVQVLLPARPNGSVGWLAAAGLQQAHTPYLVRVSLATKTIQLRRDDTAVGTWPAGIGTPATPTPVGRTFVLAALTDRHQPWSPVILPLGTHSSTLDTFAGGPGTVAIHTWPTPDGFGAAVSHGCIRVPGAALQALRPVPLGTLVLITA